MKVLSGVYPHGSYEGDILFEGEVRAFRDLADSEALGIVIIHQELALVPLLSIAENIFLGNEVATARRHRLGGDLLPHRGAAAARSACASGATTLVTDIGVGKQQLVEIAKALSKRVKLLILDEPTASLQETDSQKLLDLLLEFKAQGITSILISHKLNEIGRVADRITVLRDGATVSTLDARAETISEDRIIRDMVGRAMSDRYPPRDAEDRRGAVRGRGLERLRPGPRRPPEDPRRQPQRPRRRDRRHRRPDGVGAHRVRDEPLRPVLGPRHQRHRQAARQADRRRRPSARAVDAGLAYVTEDRKSLGLILEDHVTHNITLANLPGVSKFGVIDGHAERQVALDYRKRMNIRTPTVYQKVLNLSGGNQQKVVLSKWLFSGPEVLILDEPTRGIDVGAKYEIYTLINALADQGKGVIMISSEMPELLGMCDRIYVMKEGAFVGELPAAEASQERIMRMIVQRIGPMASITDAPTTTSRSAST